jgi:hypothetical protein
VTIYRGDGKGGFLPDPFTIAAGPEPTGIAVADVDGDGKPDVLVSNAYGDLLVLLGNGDGTLEPYHESGRSEALAVLPNGSPTPDVVIADQGLDKVVVNYAAGLTKTVADSSSGLLAPGAVKLADLSGDGIPDLIVANSGSNNVLVYPGLGNGQFGPELNGGKGFFTGTNPVSITVANLNGRPDLIIANQGSNDVSILLNVGTADGGFTFVPGPRLKGGLGPTSTAVADVPGDPFPDLLISDGGSNEVRLLRGVGGGFFADQDPRIYPVGSDPVQVMVGPFLPNQGPEILAVNRDSNDVTVISNFTSSTRVFDTVSTGGLGPVAALGVTFPGRALESLVIANEGDGVFTLLGGPGGLALEQTQTRPDLPEPSALDFGAVSGDEVMFYATTAGQEAAFSLAFILPGFSPSVTPVPGSSSAAAEAPAQLVALSETSLTLLVTVLSPTPSATPPAPTGSAAAVTTTLPVAHGDSVFGENATGSPAAVNTAFFAVPPSQGQGLFTPLQPGKSEGEEAVEAAPGTPVAQGAAPVSPWVQSILGVDEAFQEIRQENRDGLLDDGAPAASEESPRGQPDDPPPLPSSAVPVSQPSTPAQGPEVDAWGCSPHPGAPGPVGQPPRWSPFAPRSVGAAVDHVFSAWLPVLIASRLVIRVNRPGKPERRVRETHR